MDIDTKELAKNYAELSDEELLRMHASGDLTDMAYTVLETELARRGISIPQRKKILEEDTQSLRAHWEGKASLSSAYWLIGVLGNLIFLFVFKVVKIEEWRFLGLVVFLVWLAYFVFATVSIWRCAWNVHWKGWGYIARVIVILNIMGFGAEIALSILRG